MDPEGSGFVDIFSGADSGDFPGNQYQIPRASSSARRRPERQAIRARDQNRLSASRIRIVPSLARERQRPAVTSPVTVR